MGTGGWDIVVFFDFMAIPQNGNDSMRTPEEQNVFDTCLPNMGVLYSIFPVLVLPEVTPGAHAYSASGWCFSELMTAMLGKQLSRYSASMLTAAKRSSLRHSLATEMSFEVARDFLADFLQELDTKTFFDVSDKKIVKGIVIAFLLKRMLLDGILSRDVRKVKSVIQDLRRAEMLETTLDQPIGASLDTCLHVAVKVGALHVVQVILQSGAQVHLRNHRGDLPGQFFMWPRCSKAAQACRATASSMSTSLTSTGSASVTSTVGLARMGETCEASAGYPSVGESSVSSNMSLFDLDAHDSIFGSYRERSYREHDKTYHCL